MVIKQDNNAVIYWRITLLIVYKYHFSAANNQGYNYAGLLNNWPIKKGQKQTFG